jgi:anti-sigma factor RsiW
MTDPNDLICRELVEMVTDYLEGRLGTTERERFEHHLDGCPGCREYLRQMRAAIGWMGSTLPPEPLPESLLAALRADFRGWRPES